MERLLGLDVGERRIGIALSDALGMTAQPIGTLQSTGWGPDVRYLSALAQEHGSRCFVLGLPKNMDGSLGFQAQRIQAFGEQLIKAGYAVVYQDERLTSVSAERALLEGGLSRSERRLHVDKTAAALILQNYLDTQKKEEKPMQEQEINIVELIGEDGQPETFEHLMTLEHEGNNYLLLTPYLEDAEEDDEAEVIIMRIEKDDQDQDSYILEEDEGIQETLFQRFIQLMEAEDEDDQDE